jgi:hypothetical protein
VNQCHWVSFGEDADERVKQEAYLRLACHAVMTQISGKGLPELFDKVMEIRDYYREMTTTPESEKSALFFSAKGKLVGIEVKRPALYTED